MYRWINGVLSAFGVQLVRSSQVDLDRPAPVAPASPDPVAAARQILDAIEGNRLSFGRILDTALKDLRIAAQMQAASTSVDWLYAHADRVPAYRNRPELLEAVLPLIPANGDLAEFGVFKGAVTWFVRPRFPDRTYHAFDSWQGVPESMGLAVDKFGFSLDGRVPDLPPATTIHTGWFEDTLPKWRAQCDASIAFAYIDCDLYESVRTVLEAIADRLRPGSIVIFDDWFNFPNWQAHSFRAAHEWTERHGLTLEPIGLTFLEHSVAFRLA